MSPKCPIPPDSPKYNNCKMLPPIALLTLQNIIIAKCPPNVQSLLTLQNIIIAKCPLPNSPPDSPKYNNCKQWGARLKSPESPISPGIPVGPPRRSAPRRGDLKRKMWKFGKRCNFGKLKKKEHFFFSFFLFCFCDFL